MGWWKIDSEQRGQVDFDTDLHRNSRSRNALPGNTPEFYYIGDVPADIVGDAAERIRELLVGVCDLDAERLRDLLLEDDLTSFSDLPQPTLDSLAEVVSTTRQQVDQEYEKAWRRPPYPEEWTAVINFVLGPECS